MDEIGTPITTNSKGKRKYIEFSEGSSHPTTKPTTKRLREYPQTSITEFMVLDSAPPSAEGVRHHVNGNSDSQKTPPCENDPIRKFVRNPPFELSMIHQLDCSKLL
ncbi:hypothetical protein BC938DRAFT_483896 [Jimgerdemannia flammicorona]|uniref:Uncharacterized protein n=1 Tax=Jimgerdemannia flammicorona TaxID=994334 RepID=A0A433QB00_9FUNG|nr:hypothetical protein BC938DRAFT_483896 [Jimgerdemannia flammicorona]